MLDVVSVPMEKVRYTGVDGAAGVVSGRVNVKMLPLEPVNVRVPPVVPELSLLCFSQKYRPTPTPAMTTTPMMATTTKIMIVLEDIGFHEKSRENDRLR